VEKPLRAHYPGRGAYPLRLGPLPLLHAGGRQPPAEAGRAGAQIAAAGAPLCASPRPRPAPLRWPAARAGAVAPPSPPAAVFVRGEGAAGAAGRRADCGRDSEREGERKRERPD